MNALPRESPHNPIVLPWERGTDPRFATAFDALSGAHAILQLLRNDALLRERRENTDRPEEVAPTFYSGMVDGLHGAMAVCLQAAERSLGNLHDLHGVKS